MKSQLSSLAWVLPLLASFSAGANIPRASGKTHEPGKDVYTVVPKEGVDTSATVDFIKSTVGTDELLPWTDVHGQLMSWTVEASPDEFARLEEHTGIDHVAKLEVPAQRRSLARWDEHANSKRDPMDEKTQCNGLADNVYVDRNVAKTLIETEFCPLVEAQGVLDKDSASILRTYHQGTPEEVSLSVDFKPGTDFKPNKDDCIKYLMKTLDNCETGPTGNPENYKGGGSTTVGAVGYRITPQAKRASAEDGKKAGCDSSRTDYSGEYWVWGRGFSTLDRGESLKKDLETCVLLDDSWSFDYGLGHDGREWTAKFRAYKGKECVGRVVGEAGEMDDFACRGS